jgi:hypothetical protein
LKIKNQLTVCIFIAILYAAFFFLVIKLVPQRYSSKPLFDPLIHDLSTVFDKTPFWKWECVDTMKYSRDTARAWNDRPQLLEKEINLQISSIKKSGANCVALATPYETEFVPFLEKWVKSARKNNLNIWFRGNVAGWEKWFDYEKVDTKEKHNEKTYQFIVKNAELFEEGDVFTPAPEPENGGFGDPRRGNDIRIKFNEFLISSFQNCEVAFFEINKKVKCGVFSSNFDVASVSLDQNTVQKTGGAVAIDHYVSNPKARYANDILNLHKKYGQAKVWIGEFGGPIPDLNGEMDETQQAQLVNVLLEIFYEKRSVIEGINYWTLKGGSTKILNDDGSEREALKILKNYFAPGYVRGYAVPNSTVKTIDGLAETKAERSGRFTLQLPAGHHKIIVEKLLLYYKTYEVDVKSGEVVLIFFHPFLSF